MLLVHNLRRKKEKRKSKILHQDSTQDLQKTTGGQVHEFGFFRKLPFCSLMKIKRVGFDMQVRTDGKGPCTHVLRYKMVKLNGA